MRARVMYAAALQAATWEVACRRRCRRCIISACAHRVAEAAAPLAAWAVFVSNAVWAHHVAVTLGGWRLSRLVVRVIGRV